MTITSDAWAKETDVIVVGSGSAGLTAALTAGYEGARTLVMERAKGIGGTSIFSGGLVWVPNNHHMPETGMSDSREEALAHLRATMPDRKEEERWEAFVDNAPKMLRFVERHTPLRFMTTPYPDSFAEREGGKTAGRNVETRPVELRLLGTWENHLLKTNMPFRIPITVNDYVRLKSKGFKGLAGLAPTIVYRLLTRRAAMGDGLIAGLLKGCRDNGVELMLDTRARELVQKDGRIVGIRAGHSGKSITIKASKGVVLASGGFERNEELKAKFLPGPIEYPPTPPFHEGDGLVMAEKVGAKLAYTDETWYWPTGYIPGHHYEGAPLGTLVYQLRYNPHSIIVNRAGKRFVNEASHNMALALYERSSETGELINQPCWAIFDRQFRRKYSFLVSVFPFSRDPHWLMKDGTLEGLAQRVGIDPKGLSETVARFNEHARHGTDPDFHKGEFAYDRFNGAKNEPHPNLGTIERPPFYAVPIYASTVGTKGGPMTNAKWQVVREDGTPIPGLYAAGNACASFMGPVILGAGGTIGPGMTGGYICGINIAQEPHAS